MPKYQDQFNKKELDIIHVLGLKYGIPDREMQNIIKSQFEVLKHSMEESSPKDDNYNNVMIPNFGKIYVTISKKNKLREYYGYKDSDETEEGDTEGADNGWEDESADE